ncbi:MAG: LuxR C-terminal-related transcriptional regulator [Coriobacteriaceae bacterium]|jgi:DNA-binding CsgD family transcriptional regulator|nr:LuxR C-terminal-related transcriptional regulator [Coriobacteriaceae bacterium]
MARYGKDASLEPAGFSLLRFKKFSHEAFSPRVAGFAFSRTWIYTAFSPSLLLWQSDSAGLINTLYIFSLVALVALLIAGGIADARCDALMALPVGRALPAVLSIVGTSLIPFADTVGASGISALGMAALATGLGSGLFVLYWGRVYSCLGGPVAAAETSVAFIVAILPVPLIVLLPSMVLLAVLTVLPIASSLVLFAYCDPRRLKEEGGARDGDAEGGLRTPKNHEEKHSLHPKEKGAFGDGLRDAAKDGLDEGDAPSGWHLETVGLSWKRLMLKLVVSSTVFGCAVSLMHALTPAIAHDGAMASNGITLLLSALIAGSITLVVLFFSKRLDLAFTYRPVLVFMSVGCLLFPFLEIDPAIAWTFTMSGYLCFEIMNWTTLSDISFRFNLPPFRVFGFGRAAVSGGVLVGALAAQELGRNLEFDFQMTTALSFSLVFVMIVTHTLTLTERDIAKITRQRARMPINEAEASEGDSLERKVALLAEEHDIGERGSEVLLLLAKGRSGARIEQELYISRGTVNTHMHRLYQKLAVHNRQELLDLIDSVELPSAFPKR